MPRSDKQQHQSPKQQTNVKSQAKKSKASVLTTAVPKTAAGTPQNQPTNDELATLQATELEVLASILGDDYSTIGADPASPWQQSNPNSSFQVLLRPDTDSLKQGVFATARFRLPIRYPYLPPIISVLTGNKSFRGLSTDHIKHLQDVLTQKAKELAGKGEEMLWDVITAAQEYISANNLEIVSGPNRSLEEEKRLREKEHLFALKKKAQEESLQKTREEEERASKIAQLIREQAERNTVAIQQEKERKRDASTFSPSETHLIDYLDERASASKSSSSAAQPTEFFMDAIEQDGKLTHQIIVGPRVAKTSLYSTFYVQAAPLNAQQQAWQMDVYPINTPYYNLSSGKRALEEVEWELDRLRKLRSDTLVNVRACALVADNAEDGSSAKTAGSASKKLLIVHDVIRGPSVETILLHGVQLPWQRARLYLRDVVDALDTLHQRNVVHTDVSTANVVLNDSNAPGSPARAVLAHGGYAKRLRDMHATHPLSDQPIDSFDRSVVGFKELAAGWQAPEAVVEMNSRKDGKMSYTRKHDIWQTGVLTLQMLFGVDIVARYSSPSTLFEQAESLLEALGAHVVALLKSMMDPSARKRITTTELRSRLNEVIRYEDEEHGSSNSQLGTTTESDKLHKADVPRRGLVRSTSEREDPFRPGSFWQSSSLRFSGNTSRYENDFEELELLGKGAYGAVFRARNRLDGRDYAIKKIRLSASADNDEKTLREITALSRLSHQNIVRYVTCWIQVQDDPQAPSTTDDTITSSMQSDSLNVPLPSINDDFMSAGHDAFSGSASHIRFANSDSEEEDEDEKKFSSVGKRSKRNGVKKGDDDDDNSTNCSSSSSSSEDNSSSSSSEDDEESIQQSRMHQSFSVSAMPVMPSRPRWLFIQMEYVEEKTLREAINKGISIDDSWRLFRQMMEALAHVASLGIIHRDLKPSNILMYRNPESMGDNVGDLKIGDFGLATTTPQNQQGGNGGGGGGPNADFIPSTPFQTTPTTDESVDQTVEIGTDLYIAPEVLKSGGASRYDQKVDVYAAGIVFFEMLASQRIYKTGMERIQVLRSLRLPEVRFPKGWNEAQFQAQTKILRRMLSHEPSERPTPLEMLKSDLLPPKMEDEYIAECMRLLSMPNSTYNLQLMEMLFDRKETFEQREARDFTFDTGSNEGQGLDNRFFSVTAQYLRTLFRRRGAVELEAPLLIPPNELYAAEQHRPVEMLDRTGKVVQLPYDLLVPFARMVAHGEQQRFKRYAIAPVYRPNLLAGGQPRSVVEVDFDIVAPEKTPAAEAEVIGVVDEILDEVPGLNASEWVIQISHGAVLDLLLERVPTNRRDQAIAAIGKLTSNVKALASQGRVHLAALGLTRSITDEIDSANVSDEVDVVYEKLQRLIAIDLLPRLKRAVDSIRRVVAAAHQFGVQRRILFTPLLVSNTSFYRDNVYFVVVRGRGKRRDVLASGGRYDALLKRFASPTLARAPTHAVGVQIALGRIALALAKHHELLNTATLHDERPVHPFTPRRCDVYVASAPGLLATRIEICRELWSANISADLAYEYALEESPELQAATCKAEGIMFLVIARARGSTLKVKAIFTRTEYEVNRWELCAWLADRIQRLRNTIDVAPSGSAHANAASERLHVAAPGAMAAAASGTLAATSSATMQQASDVEVLLPERQHDKRRADKHGFNDTRRGRKQAHLAPLQEKAARQVGKLVEEMMGPGAAAMAVTRFAILAVDISTTGGQSGGNGGGGGTGGSGSSQTTGSGSGGGGMNSMSFNALSLSSSMAPSLSGTNASANAGAGAAAGWQTCSPFTLLCSAASARSDDALWRVFFEALAYEEREYGKQLRKRIVELANGKRAWLVSIRAEGGVALI